MNISASLSFHAGRREAETARPFLAKLFSPIRLNRLELPNRVLMNGLHLGFERREDPYGAIAHFYSLRARGEVGLLLAGGCSPNRVGCPIENGFTIETDDLIPQHNRITAAVHAEGGRIALQLVHFGREAFHPDLVSSTRRRAGNNLFRPHSLNSEQIQATIEDYARAVARAREAGYDGVELVASQGFLLHQFLARHINLRDDEWGGDIQGRMLFVRAVLRASRAAGGEDFPIIVRMPALDLMPDSNGLSDVLAILEMAREEGADLINIGVGTHESPIPTISNIVPPAAFSALAGFVKLHAGEVPTAVSNRINDPRLAEELLRNDVADMVAVGRPLLADYNFVAKARRNDFDGINICIACNQACLDKALFGQQVGCSVNPECGDESEGLVAPAAKPKRIAVVGGGIGGLSAACNLAWRGHKVELFEKQSRLGGQMLLAARIPGKGGFLRTIDYYVEQLRRLDVPIHLGRALEQVESFDHVIVATGTHPRGIDLPNDGSIEIVSYNEVLSLNLPVSYPAVVIGGGGVALDIAVYLAGRPDVVKESKDYLHENAESDFAARVSAMFGASRAVTILQRSIGNLAPKVGATTRWGLLREVKRLGINHIPGAAAQRAADGAVHYTRANGEKGSLPARTVVLAIGQVSDRDFIERCRRSGLAHTPIGGARSAENINITQTIRDAFMAARSL